MRISIQLLSGMLLCLASVVPTLAQDRPVVPNPDKTLLQDVAPTSRSETAEATSTKQLHENFQKLLTGAKLRGQFTVAGKPLNELQEEAYDIEKVEKLPERDMWVITARIKYGNKDLTVPVPLEVKWAGTTPVLTLDNLTLPGFGTFSARVVLHKDMYAGTWQHDQVGGHLFGMIELAAGDKIPSDQKAAPASDKKP